MQVTDDMSKKKSNTAQTNEEKKDNNANQAANEITSVHNDENWVPRNVTKMIKVPVRDIEESVQNKQELYSLLSTTCKQKFNSINGHFIMFTGQLYLPSYRNCTLDFMKAVLSNKKKVLQNYEVETISAPRFRELSVKNIIKSIEGCVSILVYLPDDLTEKTVERAYLFNVSVFFCFK